MKVCSVYGCGDSEYEGRSFLTAEEKAEELQKYSEWLEKEKQGVEEAIQRIRKAK